MELSSLDPVEESTNPNYLHFQKHSKSTLINECRNSLNCLENLRLSFKNEDEDESLDENVAAFLNSVNDVESSINSLIIDLNHTNYKYTMRIRNVSSFLMEKVVKFTKFIISDFQIKSQFSVSSSDSFITVKGMINWPILNNLKTTCKLLIVITLFDQPLTESGTWEYKKYYDVETSDSEQILFEENQLFPKTEFLSKFVLDDVAFIHFSVKSFHDDGTIEVHAL